MPVIEHPAVLDDTTAFFWVVPYTPHRSMNLSQTLFWCNTSPSATVLIYAPAGKNLGCRHKEKVEVARKSSVISKILL